MPLDARTLMLCLEDNARRLAHLDTLHVPAWVTKPADYRMGAAKVMAASLVDDLRQLRELLGIPASAAEGG